MIVKKKTNRTLLPEGDVVHWTPYRMVQTGFQIVTLLSVVFGGIQVWSGLNAKVDLATDAIRQIRDDSKDIHSELRVFNQTLTNIQIDLSKKQDRHP